MRPLKGAPPHQWFLLGRRGGVASQTPHSARTAILLTDEAAYNRLGAAVAFRRKDRAFVGPHGIRSGWRLDYVILPGEFTDYPLQNRLHAKEPPLLVEEGQFAIDKFRFFAEKTWDMMPDLWQKWSKIRIGKGNRTILLHPPRG